MKHAIQGREPRASAGGERGTSGPFRADSLTGSFQNLLKPQQCLVVTPVGHLGKALDRLPFHSKGAAFRQLCRDRKLVDALLAEAARWLRQVEGIGAQLVFVLQQPRGFRV